MMPGSPQFASRLDENRCSRLLVAASCDRYAKIPARMPFGPGARVGPYEIIAPIGAGGMGEIYRARDTRLDRTVAVKVLTGALAADAESRQRLEHEARAIAALNDPHILDTIVLTR
jgi:serine/threonine protein kinase